MLDEIKASYGDKIKISLMMGGLRPGTTEPMTQEMREEILHHWHEVNKRTGQKFSFDGAMPDGFIYDTEPPSRAVIAVSEIKPESTLDFFKSIQEAFYIGQKNVSDLVMLTELAGHFSIDSYEFAEKFNSDEIKRKTQAHFQQTRQAEVTGFPTLALNTGSDFKKISTGYCHLDTLKQELDDWLQNHL